MRLSTKSMGFPLLPPYFWGDFGATKAGAISVNVASINAGLLSLPPSSPSRRGIKPSG